MSQEPADNQSKKKDIISKISEGLSSLGKKLKPETSEEDSKFPAQEKFIEYKTGKISYTSAGTGIPTVLLHGFLENKNTWGGFADKLAKDFWVINIDLPGHGNSELMTETATPKYMAKAVAEVLEAEEIPKAFIIGHSMGGYAACAFADLFPERLSALCLFHSVPFADSADKKNARNETIQKINGGEKETVCKAHAPKVFADNNQKKFQSEIEKGTQTALTTKNNTIKATLRGMRDRDDYSLTVKELKQPFLYIQGMKDNFIEADILKAEHLPKNNQIINLEKSGHMGFIEEEQASLQAIRAFGQKIDNTGD
jgi:pimeloyl-ACP methyl ester carboxylesterase